MCGAENSGHTNVLAALPGKPVNEYQRQGENLLSRSSKGGSMSYERGLRQNPAKVRGTAPTLSADRLGRLTMLIGDNCA